MTERDVHALRAEALAALTAATQAANSAPDVECAQVSHRGGVGGSWGIKKHTSVQAGSGLVSTSSQMVPSISTSSWALHMWPPPSLWHTADPSGYGPSCDKA